MWFGADGKHRRGGVVTGERIGRKGWWVGERRNLPPCPPFCCMLMKSVDLNLLKSLRTQFYNVFVLGNDSIWKITVNQTNNTYLAESLL